MRAHPDFDGVTGSSKAFPANIAELDYRAGQILDTLDELGVARDTIVVWNSGTSSRVSISKGTNKYV